MSEQDRMKQVARAEYFTSVLSECLEFDKIDALSVHSWIYQIVNQLKGPGEVSLRTLREVRIVRNYYNTQIRRDLSPTGQQTIDPDGGDMLIKYTRIVEVVSWIRDRVEQAKKMGYGNHLQEWEEFCDIPSTAIPPPLIEQ